MDKLRYDREPVPQTHCQTARAPIVQQAELCLRSHRHARDVEVFQQPFCQLTLTCASEQVHLAGDRKNEWQDKEAY